MQQLRRWRHRIATSSSHRTATLLLRWQRRQLQLMVVVVVRGACLARCRWMQQQEMGAVAPRPAAGGTAWSSAAGSATGMRSRQLTCPTGASRACTPPTTHPCQCGSRPWSGRHHYQQSSAVLCSALCPFLPAACIHPRPCCNTDNTQGRVHDLQRRQRPCAGDVPAWRRLHWPDVVAGGAAPQAAVRRADCCMLGCVLGEGGECIALHRDLNREPAGINMTLLT